MCFNNITIYVKDITKTIILIIGIWALTYLKQNEAEQNAE